MNWDPFEDDPFEIDFFHNHDLNFPRIQWPAWADNHMRVPHSLVTRDDKNSYQLFLDVKGFDPKELSLKLVGRELVIIGEHTCKHNQKEPCFQRRLCWTRVLPDNVDLTSVKATMTKCNFLKIDASENTAYDGHGDIHIVARERTENKKQQKTENRFEHGHGTIREPDKMEEEATVEVVPDETEAAMSEL